MRLNVCELLVVVSIVLILIAIVLMATHAGGPSNRRTPRPNATTFANVVTARREGLMLTREPHGPSDRVIA